MKPRVMAIGLAMLGAMASPAFANTMLTGGFRTLNPYVGASVGLLRYNENGLPGLSPSVIVFRAGLPLSSFFAIEGRLGTGLSSDETSGYSVSTGTLAAAYAKGSLALGPEFSIYGVAGLAAVSLHRNFGDGGTTDTGLSGGIGGEFRLERALSLNVEWTHLPGGTDAGYSYSSNMLSAGVNYRF